MCSLENTINLPINELLINYLMVVNFYGVFGIKKFVLGYN